MDENPVSITDWPYSSKKSKYYHIAWGPASILVTGIGQIFTVYKVIKGSRIQPVYSGNPLRENIKILQWCRGFDSNGATPSYLFLSGANTGIVVDVEERSIIATIKLQSGLITSAIWSSVSCANIIIGDSNHKITEYFINNKAHNGCEIIWQRETTFPIDFMAISPQNVNVILIASKDGKFRLIENGEITEVYGTFPCQGKELINCRFYPFLNNLLIFVIPNAAFLYSIEEDSLVQILHSDHSEQRIINILFPFANESIFLVIHPTFLFQYIIKDGNVQKASRIQVPSWPKGPSQSILAYSMSNSNIALLTRGHFISIMELHQNEFTTILSYRGLPSVPSDYDIINDNVLIGSKNGLVMISKGFDRSIKQCFKLKNGNITTIKWLTETTFVAVVHLTRKGDRQKVIYYDIQNRTSKSILKKSLEILDKKPIQINLSRNRDYFAVVIAQSVICVYKNYEHITTIIEEESVHTTFDSITDDIFVINNIWVAKRYAIKEHETILINRTIFKDKEIKGEPTVCASISNYFVCGTSSGDFIALNWDQTHLKPITLSNKPIRSIEIAPDRFRCFILDSNNSISSLLFLGDNFAQTAYQGLKAKSLRWFDGNRLLIRQQGSSCLNFINSHTLQMDETDRTLLKGLSIEDSKKLFIEKAKNMTDVMEIRQLARDLRFTILEGIFSSLQIQEFSHNSYCANFSKERLIQFLKTIDLFFKQTQSNKMQIRKMRIAIMLDNFDEAYRILSTTSPEDEDFAVNLMKAALVSNKGTGFGPCIAALVAGGKVSDAVDLMLITGQYKNAVRLLLSQPNVELAIQLAKSKMDEGELAVVLESIVRTLLASHQELHAASLLSACRLFDQAAKILDSYGLSFVAEVVRAIRCEDGRISFNFS